MPPGLGGLTGELLLLKPGDLVDVDQNLGFNSRPRPAVHHSRLQRRHAMESRRPARLKKPGMVRGRRLSF